MFKFNTCCFTGHRLIRTCDKEVLIKNLNKNILELISKGVFTFITGGALGFDTLAAETLFEIRENKFPHIRVILALPCKNQDELWQEKDKERYRKILAKADDIIYLSESYSPYCMHKRNRFMVDSSRYCIFYLYNNRSGTYKTVKYALEKNLNIINILE